MTGEQHFKLAEQILQSLDEGLRIPGPEEQPSIQLAQVHATLAVAAFTRDSAPSGDVDQAMPR